MPTDIELSPSDLEQLRQRGMSPADAASQLALLRTPPPATVLDRPCSIGDGISRIEAQQQSALIDRADAVAAAGRVTKFVPASGAATRMFKDLIAALQDRRRPSASPAARELFEQLDDFPFGEELRKAADVAGLPESEEEERRLLTTLLQEMRYAQLPKALIPFHRTDRQRTAFEDQLLEGMRYVRDADGRCRMHFTVATEFLSEFEQALRELRPEFNRRRRGTILDVRFSEQDPSTDTLAIDPAGEPFRLADGTLLFRPGGHGSLIANLNALAADIVVIKNVDNILPDETTTEVVRWKRILIGHLAQLQSEVAEMLAACEPEDAPEPALDRAIAFAAFRFARRPAAGLRGNEAKRRWIFDALDRPIRVCGVVKNEREPGGAPFWVVEPDGTRSVQIVEPSQVDSRSPEQARIFRSAGFFNPVDIVCGLRSWRGERFDLRQYVDPDAVFVSEKTHEGRELRALERPGLWNGAMAGWNTVCAEVPASTFAPVKTVFDLLRPQHQYRATGEAAVRRASSAVTGCVLIVDAAEANQRRLQEILGSAGLQMETASDGERALEIARHADVDLVLLDMALPGVDGFEVLQRLRARPETAHIPVIFISSRHDDADNLRGLELGAADYVTRPFNRHEVLARVRAQLRIRQLSISMRRMNIQLLAKQKVLAEDLRAAADLQKALVGAPRLETPGIEIGSMFQSSIHVRGDIFDIVPLGGGDVVAYVIDVSGHGVASMLLAVSVTQRLSGAFGLVWQPHAVHSPAAMLEQLETEFPSERFGNYFSIALAVINTGTGRLRYASAGHPPPLVVRRDGRTELLRAGGPVIGMGFGLPFEEGDASLEPGDRLLLYTDGVTEDENVTGERFGTAAIAALFAARTGEPLADVCSTLLDTLTARRGDLPPLDDLALLAIERRG
jgi:serine phosphatase RsbU (regulator of sigma subunit)